MILIPTRTRTVIASACLAIASAAASGGGQDPAITDEQVELAIRRAVEFLWSAQQPDGQWRDPRYGQAYPSGLTALAAFTLRIAGAGISDPRLHRATVHLLEHEGEIQTVYARAFRLMFWTALDPNKYRKALRADVRFLCGQQNKNGSWGYGAVGHWAAPRGWSDNSNSQLTILALWEANQVGGEVGKVIWERAEDSWLAGQDGGGGWGYLPAHNPYDLRRASYGSMTAAGLATLYILYDQLYVGSAGRFNGVRIKNCGRDIPKSRPLRRAMDRAWDWMNMRFVVDRIPEFPGGRHQRYAQQWLTYYLYSIERVGVASGFKTFGANNWYRDLAGQLVRTQQPDGSWGTIDQTCFGLLALVKGRTPIVINKLRYGETDDWNNTPRDAATLSRWLSRKLETPVTWQIVDLDSPEADVKDAPILYMSGHRAPQLSGLERELLRDYVLSGGTVVAVACCSEKGFDTGARELFDDLFPRYRRHVLEADHPLWSIHYPIKPVDWIIGYSDGCRTRLFVITRGISGAWHQNLFADYKEMFQLGANLMLYATNRTAPRSVAAGMGRGRIAGLGPRVERAPDGSPRRARHVVTLGRVRHDSDFWADPYALTVLSNELTRAFDLGIRQDDEVDLLYQNLEPFDVLWLTGHELVVPDDDRLHRLKVYLAEGGTLIATACCGRPAFDEAFTAMIEKMYGPEALMDIPPDDPLITGWLAAGEAPIRTSVTGPLGSELTQLQMKRSHRRGPSGGRGSPQPAGGAGTEATPARLPVARLKGVRLDGTGGVRPGRWAIIYSPIDIHCGCDGHFCPNCNGYQPREARAVAVNMVLYVYLQK